MQANFGGRDELTIAGVPVGRVLDVDNPVRRSGRSKPPGAGSVIVIVATDAPLLPGQCKALARRVPLGLARTGTTGSHFSGDIFLAFSTANAGAMSDRIRRPDRRRNSRATEVPPLGAHRPVVRSGRLSAWKRPSSTCSWQPRRWPAETALLHPPCRIEPTLQLLRQSGRL